jgi:hypothetical protein
MTGPIVVFAPGMTAGIPVQNIPNVSVQPTIPYGGTLTTEQAIEQGKKELEQQNAITQNSNSNLQAAITAENQYTGIDTPTETENFYPESSESGIKKTTLDGNEAEYPLAYVRFQEGAEYPVTLGNGITINIPLVATNTPAVHPGQAPVEPVAANYTVKAYIPTNKQVKDGGIQYTPRGGSVPGGNKEIGAAYSDGTYWGPQGSNDKATTVNNLLASAAQSAKTDFDNADEKYKKTIGDYTAALADYNIKVKIQQGVDVVAQAAAQAFYDKEASGTSGNYLDNREKLLTAAKAAGISDPRGLENAFREFYISSDLTPRKYTNFVDVPYGFFDTDYYGDTQDPAAKEKFNEKLNLEDDVDFLATYGALEDKQPIDFYRSQYTQRVLNGENVRANEAENLKKYEGENLQAEDIITDESIQTIRDKQLGVTLDENSELDVIKNNDYWKKQYEAALSGDEKNADYLYWQELQNDPAYSTESLTGGRIPVFEISKDKPNDFVSLFLKSQREADTTAIENIQSEAGSDAYITEFEDMINNLIGQERLQQVSQFGNLTKDALQQTVAEIQNQKAKERNIAFYQGLGSFSEVFNAGKTIADSFLNDSGIGGILPMSNRGRDYAKRLEDKLEGSMSGLKNSVEYNWETWFKDTLSKRYSPNYEENKERYQPYEIKENILTAFNKFLNRNLGVDPYNQEKGEFNAVFLDAAGFNDTAELINYLNDQAIKEEEILENPESLNALTEAERAALSTSSLDILNLIQETSPTRNEVSEYSEFIKKIENLITNQRNAIDSIDEELGNNLTIDGIDETVAGRFARDFVNDYLKPRFDTSRSMDEFVEYMDVRQEEKNPFQTEDLAFALRNAGQIQANAYLEELQKRSGETSKFNTDFYFDPMGNGARVNPQKEQELQNQSETVNKDWEDAQENNFKNQIPGTTLGDTWYSQAYRYGLGGFNEEGKWTLSKDDFAQLHYWTLGQYKNYDPALDLLNTTIITDKAQNIIDTYLRDKAAAIDSPFGRFITPEEFADELLEGVDPYDEKYDQILEDLGLEDFKGTLDDLKGYIIDIMRTGSALEIRENIKYLNEQREDPSQEILGITYIDRPEDFTDEAPKGKTWLFESFQKSGYQGTEDEFYESFLPDVDRSEMELLGEVQSGKGLEFGFGLQDALSDPLAAYSNISSFLDFGKDKTDGTNENQTTTKQTTQKETSVFNVFDLGYDDEDTYTKSKSAQEFLGEFAPYFK